MRRTRAIAGAKPRKWQTTARSRGQQLGPSMLAPDPVVAKPYFPQMADTAQIIDMPMPLATARMARAAGAHAAGAEGAADINKPPNRDMAFAHSADRNPRRPWAIQP